MVAALLVCVAMTGQAASPAREVSADLKAYQEIKAKAGRTAADQVQLALWCEAHGLSAERLKHLTRAILIDGDNLTARGLLGQVSYKDRWLRPSEVQAAIDADPEAQAMVSEYLDRRAHTSDTADAHQRLAQWCDQHGLNDQATAHYKTVLRIDPSREPVWKKLGYRKNNGRWIKPEALAAERAEAEEQKHADARWKPLLEKCREGLSSKKDSSRREAEAALAAVVDPRAVPMVWAVFVRDDARLQQQAAQVFAQLDGPSASQALASLAVMSSYPEVRGRSAELLARRDPHDYLDPLLDLIHKPFQYKVVPVSGPGSEGGVFVEGERFNVQKSYRVGTIDWSTIPNRLFGDGIPLGGGLNPGFLLANWRAGVSSLANTASFSDPSEYPGTSAALQLLMIRGGLFAARSDLAAVRRDQAIIAALADQEESVQAAQQRLQYDVATIEQMNRGIRSANERALPLVKSATGEDFGEDQDAWKEWWSDQLGYAFRSSTPTVKPTYSEFQTFNPRPLPPATACFAAGTTVQTLAGPRPIESIQIGDRVLSQNATTGAISYQPVLVVHHNRPAPLLKLSLGSETILATGIHRFWKVGKGWTLARDLKPGDVVRTLGGSLALKATEPAGTAPVFNLDVAENRDFFVGESGFLVYDFSVVEPVVTPFDAPTVVAVEASRDQ